MLDDLYASENEAIVNDMIARPAPAKAQPVKFSAWKATTAAPRGVAAGAAESAGFASDVLGAFGQVMGAYPEIMGGDLTPEQRKQADEQRNTVKNKGIDYSSEGGDIFRGVAKGYMPDPETAHAAEQTVFGLTRFGSKAVGYSLAAGPVAGAGLLGFDEGLTTADALRLQGVDEATRTKVGAVAGVAAAAAPLLPVAGKTVAQTVGLVGVGGPGAFMAQQAATRQILQDAGYENLSTQYDPFDPVGLAVSTLVPAGFGAWAMRGAKLKAAAKVDGMPAEKTPIQAAAHEATQPEPARPTPEHVDAARVEMLTQHMENSGLFKPEDAKAAAMHVEAFAKAMDDMSAGRRVDITDLVPADRLQVAKALDTFSKGLEDARAELMSQAAQRAEPGAIRQMQTELADAQTQLAALEDPATIKTRAVELQQSDRLSYKQALAQARKEFSTQAEDVRARVSRLETMIEDNAQGQQAFDALNRMDQQATQISKQRSQIDAPPTQTKPTAAAAMEAAKPTTEPAPKTEAAPNVQDAQKPGSAAPAGAGPQQPAKAAQPQAADAGGAAPAGAREPGAGGVSRAGGDAAEAAVVAQRLADIQTQFPDLAVQMDGMDKPVRLADFLAEVQREAMEGTDFELGGNDAPLMQVAASCFLING